MSRGGGRDEKRWRITRLWRGWVRVDFDSSGMLWVSMGKRLRRRWRRSCREVRSAGRGRSCRDVGGGKCMLGDKSSGGRAYTL